MKRNKLIYSMIAATTLFAASCTDFDDYNEAYTDSNPLGNASLWENIEANGELSQFAEVLKYVGYDKELQNSRTYTVWAPLNGTFDYKSLLAQENKDELIKRFVNSHVANYNYTLMSTMNEKIHTLNNKSFELKSPDGANFTYDEKAVVEKNIPTQNGLLHTIDGYAQFLPNIYENIFALSDENVTKVPAIFAEYQSEELDKEHSVEGPIDADGNQTYIEEVWVTTNSLLDRNYLNAELAEEDSSYTMLIPTDEAFQASYDKIKNYYNYAASTQYWTPTREIPAPTAPIEYATPEGLGDSLVTRAILSNTVFNNNNKYNRWIDNADDPNKTDTLVTTRGVKLSNGPDFLSDEILAQGGEQDMSNGNFRVVTDLPYRSWETYNPEISVPLSRTYRPLVEGIQGNEPTTTLLGYHDKDGNLVSVPYLDFIPQDVYTNPRAYFYIPNVRSTTYNVYVAVIPSGLVETQTVKDEEGNEHEVLYDRTYKFEVAFNFAKADGKVQVGTGSRQFYNAFQQWKQTVEAGALHKDMTSPVDTVFVGQITFPVAYVGLQNCYPMVRIEGKRSTWNTTEYTKINNRLRISDIILRPVEYDEYLKKDDDLKTEE